MLLVHLGVLIMHVRGRLIPVLRVRQVPWVLHERLRLLWPTVRDRCRVRPHWILQDGGDQAQDGGRDPIIQDGINELLRRELVWTPVREDSPEVDCQNECAAQEPEKGCREQEG